MQKYDYHNSMVFIVKCTARSLEGAFDSQLRSKVGITVSQSRVIGTLTLVKDGMTQKEIAERIGIETPTLVPVIDKLEEQGLVERRPDPRDRRNNLIFLTAKSQSIWEMIVECALGIEKASRQGVPEQDLEITKKVLRAMSQNISDYLKAEQSEDIKNNEAAIQVRKQTMRSDKGKQNRR